MPSEKLCFWKCPSVLTLRATILSWLIKYIHQFALSGVFICLDAYICSNCIASTARKHHTFTLSTNQYSQWRITTKTNVLWLLCVFMVTQTVMKYEGIHKVTTWHTWTEQTGLMYSKLHLHEQINALRYLCHIKLQFLIYEKQIKKKIQIFKSGLIKLIFFCV